MNQKKGLRAELHRFSLERTTLLLEANAEFFFYLFQLYRISQRYELPASKLMTLEHERAICHELARSDAM